MDTNKLILALLTSGSSTRVAVFRNKKQIFSETVIHDTQGLTQAENISFQLDLIKSNIIASLQKSKIDLGQLNFFITKGGILKPLEGCCYYVNKKMIDDITGNANFLHVSNIGTLLAKTIATELNIPCYVAEPDSVCEVNVSTEKFNATNLKPHAKINTLMHKGVAQKSSKLLGQNYEELNLVTVLLDTEISVAVHEKSCIIDSCEILAPENQESLVDGKIIDEKIMEKDTNIQTSYEFLAYKVAKEIGALATTLKGLVDGVVITGEMTKSEILMRLISDSISYLGNILLFPSENEMDFLAEYASQILLNIEEVKEYK